MSYTSEDFEAARLAHESHGIVPAHIIRTALRVAANVVRPGLIEDQIVYGRFGTIGYEADAIRKAVGATNG